MSAVAEHDASSAPESPDETPAPPAPQRSTAVLMIVTLAASAGVIHGVAMFDHFSHWWGYGVFFLVLTYAQILWAVWLYRHPEDTRTLVPAAAASLAVIGVWIVSRTVGIQVGPQPGPEKFGAMDIVSSLDELVTAAIVVAVVAPASRLGRRAAWLIGPQAVRLGVMLCSASLFALMLGSHQHH